MQVQGGGGGGGGIDILVKIDILVNIDILVKISNFLVKIDDFIKKSWSFDQIYVFLNLIISSMIGDITPFCSSKV